MHLKHLYSPMQLSSKKVLLILCAACNGIRVWHGIAQVGEIISLRCTHIGKRHQAGEDNEPKGRIMCRQADF